MKFLYYNPLKITEDENNVCFWSDTHFGHKCKNWELPLWKARGCNSVEEHDEKLISKWNDVSTKESIFFHLGDFIFGFDAFERFERIIHHVLFKTLYIMPGNHSSGWKQHFENQQKNVLYLSEHKRVIFVPNYIEVLLNKQPIVLSHYPIASFNGQAKGSWMLHGHCHGNLYKSEIGPLLYKTKTLDVGVENSPFPQTFKTLSKFFESKENITYDHHTSSTLNPF